MRVSGGHYETTPPAANCVVGDVAETPFHTTVIFHPLPGAAFTGNFTATLRCLAEDCGYRRGDLCYLALPAVIK